VRDDGRNCAAGRTANSSDSLRVVVVLGSTDRTEDQP
jgi:hypothetical protein